MFRKWLGNGRHADDFAPASVRPLGAIPTALRRHVWMPALAVLSALLIGLGCTRNGPSPDEPDDTAPIPPIEVPPEDLKASAA